MTYMSVGVLGIAANGGGQAIVRLTDAAGAVTPQFISNHPSASCVSNPSAALGLQHDVEATPKGGAILNTNVPGASRVDAQLLLDATDAGGRCHDQGTLGLQTVPQGGLEIVDITDITKPKEIGLTTHIGQSHTVNVDPRRPHIAYSVTSDTVSVPTTGANAGVRSNETASSNALDGWEVVDLSSCMNFPAGTTIPAKREACRPQVYRYRYDSVAMAIGHTNANAVTGCHELEVYPDDKLTCGAGSAAILFDVSGTFDDRGTPNDFTDDKPRGTPLPCAVRATSTTAAPFLTGAKVTDCVTGANGTDLRVLNWKKIGAPSIEGVKHLGSAFHQGRETTDGAARPAYPPTEDIDFDHEAEFSDSRRLLLATDERGGGVAAGAQCSPGQDIPFANGGIAAYVVDRLQKSTPTGTVPTDRAKEAFKAFALDSKGKKAIFRAPVRTGPQASFCTAHVFQQIPGQNRIFMGWYTQGTQVVDFTENADGTVDFKQAGWFVPQNANQWVSSIVKNPDGSFTYFGATGDGIVGDAGRNGVDVYSVKLPAPPTPRGATTVGPSADNDGNPKTTGTGTIPVTTPTPGAGSSRTTAGCASASLLQSAGARGKGRGASFTFSAPGGRPATVEVFSVTRGSRVIDNKRVARFVNRKRGFTWNGRGATADGVYYARFTVRSAAGRPTSRRVTLVRSGGRFSVPSTTHHRPDSCGLVKTAKLFSPAFGGSRGKSLGIAFRVAESSQVTVTVRRGSALVKKYDVRTYEKGQTHRLVLPASLTRRGEHIVTIDAKRSNRRATVTLASRRI